MLNYIYLTIACIFSIELLIRLNLMIYLNSMLEVTTKVLHIVFAENISDHWKEKMVPTYAFILLKTSLLMMGILFLIILIFSLFIILSSKFLTLLTSLAGILISIIVSLTYIKLRAFF